MSLRAFLIVAGSMAPAPLLAQGGGGGGLFSVDLGLTVWTIVIFLVVLWVLRRFAWNPILGGLAARETGIRASIDEAGAMRDEARALLEEHRRELADARRQSQEIVASGREAGERLRKEIEAKAREESERMLVRARTEIERERDQALEALRKESVELALSAASRLLQQKLDGDADRQLIEGYLRELDRPAAEA
jgi:F-type H+-transporting ATPase subunit b